LNLKYGTFKSIFWPDQWSKIREVVKVNQTVAIGLERLQCLLQDPKNTKNVQYLASWPEKHYQLHGSILGTRMTLLVEKNSLKQNLLFYWRIVLRIMFVVSALILNLEVRCIRLMQQPPILRVNLIQMMSALFEKPNTKILKKCLLFWKIGLLEHSFAGRPWILG